MALRRTTARTLVIAAALTLTACSGGGGTPAATDAGGSGSSSAGTASESASPSDAATASDAASADAGSASLPDPCSLLTAAEISDVTGVTFGEGTYNEQLSAADRRICDWIASDSTFATAQVLITPLTDSGWEAAQSGTGQVSPVHDETVPGADRAFATEEGSIVAMDVHGLFIQVAYIPSGAGTVLTQTLALAAKAAARVP
ncbi:MAG: DUF3558 family protein [Actinomycetales bacterium]|nr:DUF3558 family protein [Actinomycetales bacterium]